MISAADWLRVLAYCGVRYTTAVSWANVFAKHVQPERFSLDGREIDDFTGQVLYETAMLEHLEEDLNYSAKRIIAVWPARFPTIGDAMPYAYNPEGLANRTYGGRLGNTEPGDGWRYRGSGIPMITGKRNYELLQQLTGLPLLDHPELLRTPEGAMRCGLLWWEAKVPDSAIDSIERVTRAVQGGQLGLLDRKRLTDKAGQALASIGA